MKPSKKTNKLQIEINEMRKKLDDLAEELVIKQKEITSNLDTSKEDDFFQMLSQIDGKSSTDVMPTEKESDTQNLSEVYREFLDEKKEIETFEEVTPIKEDVKNEAYINFINSKKVKNNKTKTNTQLAQKNGNNTDKYATDNIINGYANLIDSLDTTKETPSEKPRKSESKKESKSFLEDETSINFENISEADTKKSIKKEVINENINLKTESKKENVKVDSVETDSIDTASMESQYEDMLFSMDSDDFSIDEKMEDSMDTIDTDVISVINTNNEPKINIDTHNVSNSSIDSNINDDSIIDEIINEVIETKEDPNNNMDIVEEFSNFSLDEDEDSIDLNEMEENSNNTSIINESYLSIKERLDNIKKNIEAHEALLEKADKTIKNENRGKIKKLIPNYQKRIFETQKKQIKNGEILRTNNSPLSPIKKNKPY